jgi:hypothetical protein
VKAEFWSLALYDKSLHMIVCSFELRSLILLLNAELCCHRSAGLRGTGKNAHARYATERGRGALCCLGTMANGGRNLLIEVARERLSIAGARDAIDEIFDQIEIALGIGDHDSIIDWLDIGRAVSELS